MNSRISKSTALLSAGNSVWILLLCLMWHHPVFSQSTSIPQSGESASYLVELSGAEKKYLKKIANLSVPLIEHQPPLSYLEMGQPEGYLNELLMRVAEILGIGVTRLDGYSYSESLRALTEGHANLLNDYSSYAEKSDFIIHTSPVLTIPFVAVGRTDDAEPIRTIEKLRGRKIVLVSGFQQSRTIQQRYPQLEILVVDNIEQAYRAIRTREADYYIDNATHAGYFLRSKIITDLKIAGEFSSSEMGVLELRFAVRNDQPLLLSAIEKALNSIDFLDIQSLRNKWINNQPQQKSLKLNDDEKAWLKGHPDIRLASDIAWLPFETIDENGVYSGIAAEYMKLVESRLGIKFITSPLKPWDKIVNMMKNRELDVYTCAMETAQRKRYTKFTRPYLTNPMVIVARDTVGFIDGLNGLSGKKVSIEKGYASYDLLSDKHPELELKTYPDSLSAVLALSRGEVFAYIGNIANFSHIVRSHGITNTRISGQVPYSFELAMGVRSDWPEFVPILQKALDSIGEEEKNAILQKWIGIEVESTFDYTLIWQITGIALLLFMAILYWNVTLNRKVYKRTQQLQYQAHYDALTELPNRVLAFDRLSQLIKESQRNRNRTALLFLDLDDFKKINDTMGHDAGDWVLKDVATRLRSALRMEDTIGRLGGDEFIIVCGGLNDAKDATPVAESLINQFKNAFMYEDRELKLTTSIGISVYPDNGKIPSELLQNADTAMYHSKQEGRNTYSFFTDSMNRKVTRSLLLEEHMHGALAKGEFSLHYQPKVDISSRQITGVEALLRWHNPLLGEVSPLEFIPIAEHNGMILPIGHFVLEESLQMLSTWRRKQGCKLSVAVNLSPRQFRDPGLVKAIADVIEQSAVPYESLELEITEGVLMNGHFLVEEALVELKQLGISISMDDFGTGFSSLSYLRKYPFDVLKIDRDFINDLMEDNSDQKLVSTIISMAHSLGLKVVAEGVETSEQLAFLAAKGCDIAQGYYFSKPLTAEEMSALLGQRQNNP